MAPSTVAAQLKEQGNAFFTKKDFERAHEKYTEAIAIDGQNAVLYANRSACNLAMGRGLDALRDAHQATTVDPTYAKGWSRRATAHDATMELKSAIVAWSMAIDALPKTDLTPAERQQKDQYTASLQKAKERRDAMLSMPSTLLASKAGERQPWEAAAEMILELQAAPPSGPPRITTSAYVMHFANKEFTQGVEYMKSLKKVLVEGAPDGYAVVGHTNGLTCISNGIIRDPRVFRMDCHDWIDKYDDQVTFEAEQRRAWVYDGLEGIKKSALERLKKGGWDELRPALAVTVRGWIMKAFFDSELKRVPYVAVQRFKETLELLHWGRQVWRDVPKDDRGAVFEETFIRGVKAMYLEALMGAHTTAGDVDKQAFLDTLLEESRGLVEEVEKWKRSGQLPSTEPIDPGFLSSLFIYATVQAHATTGYCFAQMARSTDDVHERMISWGLAGKGYMQAALCVPPDDEKHCWYLHCTIDPLVQSNAPKQVLMAMVNQVREAMPKMQRIWGNSALARQGRDELIEKTLRFAESRPW